MKFCELFKDMMDEEIEDDIAEYFKLQTKSDLLEFRAMKEFIEELEIKVKSRNDKN